MNTPRHVKIDIDTRTFVRFWLVVIAFVLALGLIYWARAALLTIGIAVFLALALNPPVSYISRRLPGKSRVGATALAYVAVVLFLVGFVFAVVPPVVEQTAKFIQTVPDVIKNLSGQTAFIDNFVDQYNLRDQYNDALKNAQDQAAHFASSLSGSFVNGVGIVFNAFTSTLIILVLTFFMLVEGPGWLSKIWGLYRDQERLERHQLLMHRMYGVVTGYVNGQLLVAATAAASAAITVLILSLIFNFSPSLAMTAAAFVFIGGLIPLFGPLIGGAIAAILISLNSVSAAIVFLIYFIVYQQIENNFISPTIQSRTVELSALMILAAITIGVSLFGILGGLISIPIAGCLRVLLMYYLEKNRQARLRDKKA
ncbi:MAG TPA: AI-2E family transporter [Verrucomicrobiae bacterium]|nr:AI-2E family transporter [Verrucomicrobiae bacterium]